MAVVADGGRETETVVRFAKAWIISAAQQQIDRGTVAIGPPQIAQGIKHQSERIDLAGRMVLHARAVRLETIGVAGIHRDLAAVLGGERRIVFEAVIGINPAIESAPERAGETVQIFVETKFAENFFTLVG